MEGGRGGVSLGGFGPFSLFRASSFLPVFRSFLASLPLSVLILGAGTMGTRKRRDEGRCPPPQHLVFLPPPPSVNASFLPGFNVFHSFSEALSQPQPIRGGLGGCGSCSPVGRTFSFPKTTNARLSILNVNGEASAEIRVEGQNGTADGGLWFSLNPACAPPPPPPSTLVALQKSSFSLLTFLNFFFFLSQAS